MVQEFAFLASSHSLMVWSPHFENHRLGCPIVEKGTTEDEMIGWYHRLNGHEFEQTAGDGERQKPGMLQSMGSQRVGHD